jgi:ferredoxin
MSEKLLPCPFCGSTDLEILPEDPSRDGNAWGAVQCVNVDCSTYDILKRHGVRVGDGQDVSDERGSDAYKSAAIAAWNRRTPAPEGEACPHDAYETDAAGQPVRCVDCGMAIASAASPVVPVGVSREEIARIIEPEFFSIGRAGPGYETHRASAFRKADAILAALRPTDTGRE